MTRNRSKTRSFFAFLLLVSMLMTSFFSFSVFADEDSGDAYAEQHRTSLDNIESVLTAMSYEEYIALYGKELYGGELSEDELKDVNKIFEKIDDDVVTSVRVDIFNPVDMKPEGELTDEQKGVIWSTSEPIVKENGVGIEGDTDKSAALITEDDGIVSWSVTVPEDGFYSIYIEYYTGNFDLGDGFSSKATAAERYVLIDGNVPYKEARSVEFNKMFADAYPVMENGKYIYDENNNKVTYLSDSEQFKEFLKNQNNMTAESEDRQFATDNGGNELKPEKALVSQWVSTYLYDSTGYNSDPLRFYLTEGTHTLSLQAVREPLAIRAISLQSAPVLDSYEEYIERCETEYGAKDYTGSESVKIQAEYPVYTSGDTIYALNDRSSSYSEPQDAALIRLNEIGGDKWQYVGQWIEWEITVPEDGFYSIIPRSRQNYYSGTYVSRKIYINGSVPFEEAKNLQFLYTSEWQTNPLSDGNGTPFKFYLEAGKVNTIRLEVVLGDMASVLSRVENSLGEINEYYRKILMITGPDPDSYRDYGFDKLIPEVVDGLEEQSRILKEVSQQLTDLVGEKGEQSTTLDRVALTCERMGTMPEVIASEMGTLKDLTASLGTWLSDSQNQPLDIDYFVVQSVLEEAPEAEPGFFESLWYEIKKFFMSFFSDYNNLGSSGDEGSKEGVDVSVWVATSRDQAQILRTLVDDDFAPNYEGINVDIQLVAGGTLLPATLAGTGPDVYLGGAQGDPVNYAIRSAVLSLNTQTNDPSIGYNFTDLENSVWNTAKNEDGTYKYEDFHNLIESGKVADLNEVKEWFADEALIPLTLYGETYGLPMTMSFSMMFYRKDIFVELGIEVPNTWDDFYDIIYTLQSNALDIGFPQGTGGSMVMMYQQGDELYDMMSTDEKDTGNPTAEYYLELFRRYYYDGEKPYDELSEEEISASVDAELIKENLVYEENGVLIPKTDGMTINLDSDISLAAFKDVCEFFTMYDFPISFDPANRFRSGEMPIMIQDYTVYNTLIIFAPEINGLWEFTPLPGHYNEIAEDPADRMNFDTIGGISAVMLMNSVSGKEDVAFGAWAFMQWYLDEEAQSAYGNEMVALLGPSAKQPTSNMNALGKMAWSTDELKNLESQFEHVQYTPEFPGSYIIGRYTNFAFLDVVNNEADPIEEMRSYIPDINVEISRKRSEFGLPTIEDIRDMEAAVKEKYPDWDEGR